MAGWGLLGGVEEFALGGGVGMDGGVVPVVVMGLEALVLRWRWL